MCLKELADLGINPDDTECGPIETLIGADISTLDILGIRDPSESKTKSELEKAAKYHFLNTVKIENERFMVSLPWIEGHRLLPDNYDLTLKRLNSTLKKIKVDGLYEDYGNLFQDWLKERIIEEVPLSEKDVPCHYLPHRHTVKENSTTRIRPVFDASTREKGHPVSMNV
ncbi:uncharacterized protein LOC118182404 [Stegodyphus dumicola]|uniref:uncharacterized protein LOC118182404 n=1 Tax=Stegodyphus dumicola TaxID=202533 RepID=UPI0015B032E9|nr:uncharacterized protein LOC118182404 [Stegodyphus dumicola]